MTIQGSGTGPVLRWPSSGQNRRLYLSGDPTADGRTGTAGTGPIQRTRVNGIPASYVVGRANTSSGAVDVGVFAYQWDANTIYHFVTLTRGGRACTLRLDGGFASPHHTDEASAIRPKVIDVVTVQRGDTIQSLASRMAYRNFQLDRFLTLNGLAANSQLVPGQKVKIVVYGSRRS